MSEGAVAPPERSPRGELVIAFVSPLGTPLDDVQTALIEDGNLPPQESTDDREQADPATAENPEV